MFDLENSKFFCVEAAIHANHDSAKNTDFTGCSFELFSLSKLPTLVILLCMWKMSIGTYYKGGKCKIQIFPSIFNVMANERTFWISKFLHIEIST